MMIPEMPVSPDDIEAARNDLNLTMQLLAKVLDNPPDVLEPELDIIRCRRANRMHECATRLCNLINGRRTR